MASSVDLHRQLTCNNNKPFISAERSDCASISSNPASLQSDQRSETRIFSGDQMQSTSAIEVNGTEAAREDVEDPQQKEEGEENEEAERGEALRQTMRDLEGTTGFDSYKAYLESFRHDPMYMGRSYPDIIDGCFHNRRDTGSGVDIIDVSNEDPSPVGVSLRYENLSASEISWALCHPPPSTRAQIVLWPMDNHTRNIEDFINVLGLGLQLDPCFFEPLRWRDDENRCTQHFRSKNTLFINSIGTSVFVARSFVLAQNNPVPVVLIAGPMHEPIENFNFEFNKSNFTQNNAIYNLVQAAPLYYHYKCGDGKPCFANTYIRTLISLLKSGRDSALSSSDTLFACIIPLLQIEIAMCKGDLDCTNIVLHFLKGSSVDIYRFRTKYLWRYATHRYGGQPHEEAPEFLYLYRTKLRSWIGCFENQNGALMSLISSLLGPNVTEGPFYRQIKEESIAIAQEASRLEGEIRDHLQLQGSRLALLESHKSIELSSNQIDEGKRVKIITILAFFYVPLNLATSIFGMNLQQLNGSGTSIGAFLGTVGGFLFVTGVSWLFIERIQNARIMFGRLKGDRTSVLPRNSNVAFLRFYMIWWLGRNGLFKWMTRTGAGWCLLINSSEGFQPSGSLSYREGLPAFDFVLDLMLESKDYRSRLISDRGGWLPKHKANGTSSTTGSCND